jgi:hypothetical protein
VGDALLTGYAQWSITTRSELFTPSGSHIYASDDFQPDEEVDIEQVRELHISTSALASRYSV